MVRWIALLSGLLVTAACGVMPTVPTPVAPVSSTAAVAARHSASASMRTQGFIGGSVEAALAIAAMYGYGAVPYGYGATPYGYGATPYGYGAAPYGYGYRAPGETTVIVGPTINY